MEAAERSAQHCPLLNFAAQLLPPGAPCHLALTTSRYRAHPCTSPATLSGWAADKWEEEEERGGRASQLLPLPLLLGLLLLPLLLLL